MGYKTSSSKKISFGLEMPKQKLDYLIIGPAAPFRGGIADTQNELGEHLLKAEKKVQLLTFTKLYPNFLFPGNNQKRKEDLSTSLDTIEIIHAYNPFLWRKVVLYINNIKPQHVIFRYYTPFLAPVYGWIAKRINSNVKKIALVDNWIPHERHLWDNSLNCYFGNQMNAFTTLSPMVASQIKNKYKTPIWEGFHPINTKLLPPISISEARKKLGWDTKKSIVLFFGLIRQYKGLALLIKAFADKELDEENIVLKIIGESYEDEKIYTDLVERLGLKGQVEFDFNFKTVSEIQILFSACDIVAQTYHTATQSGVTPIAYFYNKPLVVSDIEGLNTPIKKDQTGVCVQKNPKAIAKGIKYLLEENVIQKKIEYIKGAIPSYSWKQWVEKWDGFIQNI